MIHHMILTDIRCGVWGTNRPLIIGMTVLLLASLITVIEFSRTEMVSSQPAFNPDLGIVAGPSPYSCITATGTGVISSDINQRQPIKVKQDTGQAPRNFVFFSPRCSVAGEGNTVRSITWRIPGETETDFSGFNHNLRYAFEEPGTYTVELSIYGQPNQNDLLDRGSRTVEVLAATTDGTDGTDGPDGIDPLLIIIAVAVIGGGGAAAAMLGRRKKKEQGSRSGYVP